jgi:lipopolysaccharide/colanic/teichoic acid biosynthesis glycosyltransferase
MHEAGERGLPRWFEAIAASVALIALAPLLALIAAAIACTSPGPVFFRHRRCGRGGRPFEMLKFRTMRAGVSGPPVTARGDTRITAVGRVLRRTKLDELPELWNVVGGDMSLVGPRPEAVEYAAVPHPLWPRVLSVRPGITDPMTLRLRNEEELLARAAPHSEAFYRNHLLPFKLAGYAEYIGYRTWRHDVSVLWQTAVAIVIPGRAPAPSTRDIKAQHLTDGDAA